MTRLMIAASLSLALALFGTPVAIRILRAKGIGQRIREDGPKAHVAKKGTPTMGGLVIIGAAVVAYAAAHIPLVAMHRHYPENSRAAGRHRAVWPDVPPRKATR